jgi:hypothetical protein
MIDKFIYVKTLEDYTYYVNYLQNYDAYGLDAETFENV